LSLINIFYWSYKCSGCNHRNKHTEEDHDFSDVVYYELEENCMMCDKNHKLEIYCKPRKDVTIFVNGVEQN